MKKMVGIALLLLLTACDEKTQTDVVEKSSRDKIEYKNETKKQQSDNILRNMGIEINGEKISFDFNKTASFMKQIEIDMHGKADEIERKIENAEINITQGLGVEIGENSVSLDLNKTRNMLQQINILMKDILLEGNSTNH